MSSAAASRSTRPGNDVLLKATARASVEAGSKSGAAGLSFTNDGVTTSVPLLPEPLWRSLNSRRFHVVKGSGAVLSTAGAKRNSLVRIWPPYGPAFWP